VEKLNSWSYHTNLSLCIAAGYPRPNPNVHNSPRLKVDALDGSDSILVNGTDGDLAGIERDVDVANNGKGLANLAAAKVGQVLDGGALDDVKNGLVVQSDAANNGEEVLVNGADLELSGIEGNGSTTNNGEGLLDITADLDAVDGGKDVLVKGTDGELASVERDLGTTDNGEGLLNVAADLDVGDSGENVLVEGADGELASIERDLGTTDNGEGLLNVAGDLDVLDLSAREELLDVLVNSADLDVASVERNLGATDNWESLVNVATEVAKGKALHSAGHNTVNAADKTTDDRKAANDGNVALDGQLDIANDTTDDGKALGKTANSANEAANDGEVALDGQLDIASDIANNRKALDKTVNAADDGKIDGSSGGGDGEHRAREEG
jgi:hypothetical protein